MKNLFVILVTIMALSNAWAQDSDYKTVFGNNSEPTKISGFGTVSLDFGSINGDFALMMGGDGAVLFNRSFYVGGYGRGLTTTPAYNYKKYSSILDANVNYTQRASFGHGGILIGAVFYPTKPIHFGLSGKLGVGGIGLYDEYYYNTPNNYNNYVNLAPVYVITPQADLEINLTYWFKFRASAGYQWVSSQSLNYLTKEEGSIVQKELLNSGDFSTPTFSLGFVFGWFK